MILEVNNLKKHYPISRPMKETIQVKALDGVSFSVDKKKTLGIVGESGCGKSTLAKALMGLEIKTDGSVKFEQSDIFSLESVEFRKAIQMIFQDPYSSLNPRKKAWQLISEPLMINTELSKQECFNQAVKLMEKVGLRREMAERFPHMFSGGQRQRLGIARALALHPKVLICDEPVSALDVSIQAQVLNLLMELQEEMELTYLFISHDLHVVNHISDDILVMYLGKVVEYGKREKVFDNPLHPYTKALIASSPSISVDKEEHEPISGELPSPLDPPKGCAFHKRCPLATARCSSETPSLEEKDGRMTACFEV